MIKKSTTDDKELVQQLMQLCFGDNNKIEPYENLEDRYYLLFKDNTLVAMTGLTSASEYGRLEIDWTCTHPEHRHNGYMKELFTKMLNGVQEPVYCSCWRLSNKNKPNLYTLMCLFDFEEFIQTRVHWKVPHNCFCKYASDCPYCTGIGCECYEDLYLRKGKQE